MSITFSATFRYLVTVAMVVGLTAGLQALAAVGALPASAAVICVNQTATIVGTEGDDDMYADAGTDTLTGGDGNDQFYAGGGVNDVSLGYGDDQALLENGTNTVDGGPDDDAFWGGAGEDAVSGGPHRAGDICFQYIETVDKCEFQRFDQYHQLPL